MFYGNTHCYQDSLDEADLLKVHFETLLDSNQTLIDGHCVGGWKNIGTTCFLFVTALMNYYEAKRFCQVILVSVLYYFYMNAGYKFTF